MSDQSPSRFDRDLDVEDPTAVAVSRFERIDRETDLVDAKVKSGAVFEARAAGKRLLVQLRPEGPSGRYPTLRNGLLSLGGALEGEPLEDVPGDNPGLEPADKALLEGDFLVVEKLGDLLQATWSRNLPGRSYTFEGKEHHVYRKGTRMARAGTVLGAALAALEAEEKVTEGSLFKPPAPSSPCPR